MTTPIALTIAGSDSSGRRRHPGRPQDVCRARRLRRLRDHGADRAEHQGRQRHPRRCRPSSSPRRSMRCFPISTVGAVKIGMVAHPPVIDAIVAGLSALVAEACRARSRDGRNLGRPAARRGGGRRAAHKTHSAGVGDHAQSAGSRGSARRGRGGGRSRRRETRQAIAGAGLQGGADQGRPRARAPRASTIWSIPPASSHSPRRASPPRIPTAPAARCPRRLPRGSPRARTWKPPCATPRPGSAPRSRPPTVSASAMATGRSIIFTSFTEPSSPASADACGRAVESRGVNLHRPSVLRRWALRSQRGQRRCCRSMSPACRIALVSARRAGAALILVGLSVA